ncbi:hypothetical protein BCD64_15990 [Nostoc sp. MBR 210]|uniref:WD repeat-containing protein n=1 Tax=Nostoc spongiaeforme FACHB-130 TaxID=1357510 RepID=A0ABR8FZC6_9NOSO|nr:hypothetical protein [Nostoc spongiaeforme]MBD2596291.1 hypothetical protein [Nostoc spongiaeforme FACHB-130]OCQ97084.1 hypothetical protein BCD64_15990 [Nostoc sp. MBR 210]
MNTSSNFPESVGNNAAAAERLARAIKVAAGEFSLILVCCDSISKRQQILKFLKELSSVAIQELILSPTDETLYTTITNNIGLPHPQALIVHGLESVVAIPQLLISTNLMRDEFRKNLHFPIVLWVNDEVLSQLVWLAPDLKNWAATTIRFDVDNPKLVENQVLWA